jgi:hypothetical protein
MYEVEMTVVAQGSLHRLKEMMRDLDRVGVAGKVLKPSDGCINK